MCVRARACVRACVCVRACACVCVCVRALALLYLCRRVAEPLSELVPASEYLGATVDTEASAFEDPAVIARCVCVCVFVCVTCCAIGYSTPVNTHFDFFSFLLLLLLCRRLAAQTFGTSLDDILSNEPAMTEVVTETTNGITVHHKCFFFRAPASFDAGSVELAREIVEAQWFATSAVAADLDEYQARREQSSVAVATRFLQALPLAPHSPDLAKALLNKGLTA